MSSEHLPRCPGGTARTEVTRESTSMRWGLVWRENDRDPGTLRVRRIEDNLAMHTSSGVFIARL